MKSDKMLFVAHEYHEQTKSCDFMIALLRKYYNIIDVCYGDLGSNDCAAFSSDYDIIICWQLSPESILNQKCLNYKRVVYFPMYDHIASWDLYEWSKFRSITIISFCKFLYNKLKRLNFDIHYYQYFPVVPKDDVFNKPANEKSCFFWQRTNEITPKYLKSILQCHFSHLHIHNVIDPGSDRIDEYKLDNCRITYSKWFDNKEELDEVISNSTFYIAPRRLEGIGMSFLEAMALNRIVIAPDLPTMNEYIVHGKTGFLYNYSRPTEISFDDYDLEDIKKRINKMMRKGAASWQKDIQLIVDLLKSEPVREFNLGSVLYLILVFPRYIRRLLKFRFVLKPIEKMIKNRKGLK